MKRYVFAILSLMVFSLFSINSYAQDSLVIVHGKVTQEQPIGFANLIIVNLRTGLGYPGNPNGTFTMQVRKSDEIMIYCDGFDRGYISLKDSIYKPQYHVSVELKMLEVFFDKPVTIRPGKTLEELKEEQEKIGSNKYDPIVTPGVAGLSNPVSLFYQLFSKKEDEKREYVALLNEKAYEDALKDIIRYFIQADVFFLQEDEMDDFIRYCKLNPDFVKTASLYEIGEALNYCYKYYEEDLQKY